MQNPFTVVTYICTWAWWRLNYMASTLTDCARFGERVSTVMLAMPSLDKTHWRSQKWWIEALSRNWLYLLQQIICNSYRSWRRRRSTPFSPFWLRLSVVYVNSKCNLMLIVVSIGDDLWGLLPCILITSQTQLNNLIVKLILENMLGVCTLQKNLFVNLKY